MAKSAKRKTDDRVGVAADRAPSVRPSEPIDIAQKDIARRAYDLFLARGCEQGHELEDWLRAEQELRQRTVA
jgi:hypothetical protein